MIYDIRDQLRLKDVEIQELRAEIAGLRRDLQNQQNQQNSQQIQ